MSFFINNYKTVVQQNAGDFLSNTLGEEIVMMNMNTGDYIGINKVGSDIWNIIKEPISIKELIEKVLEIYDVSEQQCTAAVEEFLQKIEQHGMLLVKEAQ